MIRSTSRSVLRTAQSSLAPARTIAGRRFISTEPPHMKGRSWKSSAARWGIAVAGLYYYNTSPVFAEQPSNNLLNPNVEALEDHEFSSLESLTSQRQRQEQKNASVLESVIQTTSSENASLSSLPVSTKHDDSTTSSSPADLEEEAEAQGAFNEETGEINWDCPCLGGMAHGPCGPQFREAFSCFVFSKEEPKGMDCIEKFKGMQDCFQQHPDVYKGELEGDEELDASLEGEKAELEKEIAQRRSAIESKSAETSSPSPASSKPASLEKPQKEAKVQASSEPHPGMSEEHEAIYEGQSSPATRTPSPPPVEANKVDEDLDLVPKSWHDARDGETSGKKTES